MKNYALLLCWLLLATLPLCAQGSPSFGFTEQDFVAGNEPSSVVIADFNHDDRLDVAVANFLDGTVSVFLGNGDGTLQPALTFAATIDDFALTSGDFNGDGNLDLAASDEGGQVSILLGNGDGTFQAKKVFAGEVQSHNLAAGDFNQDGKLDLIVPGAYDAFITLLLGNGDGTFQAPVTVPIVGAMGSVVVADFNGDGKLDVAGSANQFTFVNVLLGNGDGTFQPVQTYDTGNTAQGMTTADFNGDGVLDLAVAGSYTLETQTSVAILLGNGNGTFATPVDYRILDGFFYTIAAGDVNGDGKIDLVVNNGVELPILLGNGDGTFQNAVGFGPAAGISVALGDFNQDGKLDIVSSDVRGFDVGVLTQTLPAKIKLSTTSIDFGSVKVNTQVSQTVKVTSTGTGTLVLSRYTFTNAGRSAFSEHDTCTDKALTPGKSCTITVYFEPVKAQSYKSNMLIYDNGTGEPHVVVVSGTGTP